MKVWKVVSRKPLFKKQTQSKEKILFWKPNQTVDWKVFFVNRKVFLLTGKYFPVIDQLF